MMGYAVIAAYNNTITKNPNNVPNTQTVKIRGTGAATKGTGASKKMG